jgi:hypothetical protein
MDIMAGKKGRRSSWFRLFRLSKVFSSLERRDISSDDPGYPVV